MDLDLQREPAAPFGRLRPPAGLEQERQDREIARVGAAHQVRFASHEPARAAAHQRELGVPDGLEALDRGEADPLRAERDLIGADGSAVERDFTGRAHAARADRGLQLLDAEPRRREHQPTFHVTDHERQITNGDQPPADRAAAKNSRLRHRPGDAHVELELSGCVANLLAQDGQQRERHVTAEPSLERAGIVEPARGRGGPKAAGDVEAVDGEPAGLAADDDGPLRVQALPRHLEADGLETHEPTRRARVSHRHVERGHGREPPGGIAEEIRAELAENRPELEVGRRETRRDHAVQPALGAGHDPGLGQGDVALEHVVVQGDVDGARSKHPAGDRQALTDRLDRAVDTAIAQARGDVCTRAAFDAQPSRHSRQPREIDQAGARLDLAGANPPPPAAHGQRRIQHHGLERGDLEAIGCRLERRVQIARRRDRRPGQAARFDLPRHPPCAERALHQNVRPHRSAATSHRRKPGPRILQARLLRLRLQIHPDGIGRWDRGRSALRPREAARGDDSRATEARAGRREAQRALRELEGQHDLVCAQVGDGGRAQLELAGEHGIAPAPREIRDQHAVARRRAPPDQ